MILSGHENDASLLISAFSIVCHLHYEQGLCTEHHHHTFEVHQGFLYKGCHNRLEGEGDYVRLLAHTQAAAAGGVGLGRLAGGCNPPACWRTTYYTCSKQKAGASLSSGCMPPTGKWGCMGSLDMMIRTDRDRSKGSH